MTQCHAGGFHYLGVPRNVMPNPKWFQTVPEWVGVEQAPVVRRIAGFTATDEFSAAAGCDPAPDIEGWEGYERFIPEKLFGLDLFTLEQTERGLGSFAAAHEAATLVDRTIDKPYSSSEQYLERWATLIEKRLLKETDLTPKSKKWLAAFTATVNGVRPKVSDRAFRQRQAQFGRFIDALGVDDPSLHQLLLTASRKELEETADNPKSFDRAEERSDASSPPDPAARPPRRRGGRVNSGMRRLWNEVVRPAWREALDDDAAANLVGPALALERYILSQETDSRDYFFGRRSSLDEQVFWFSGYSNPATVNRTEAESIVRWPLQRRERILAWAKGSDDEELREAAEELERARLPRRASEFRRTASDPEAEPMSVETAVQRTLFYRRVLAAWQFLLLAKERPALARVRELTELERIALPRSKR